MGEVLAGLLGLLLMVICVIAVIALPAVVIWWICKCIVFFVKVPNQLETIITSLNIMQKQIASIDKQLKKASVLHDQDGSNLDSLQDSDKPDLDSVLDSYKSNDA